MRLVQNRFFLLIATGTFFFYSIAIMSMFNVLQQPIQTSFGLTTGQMGNIASAYFYANCLFLIPVGLLLDRYSPRLLMLYTLVYTSIAVYVIGHSDSIVILAIMRFVMGIGGAFSFISCVRIASNWFLGKEMGLATGIIAAMGMLGGLVVQTPFMRLIQLVGWQHSLWALIGLSAVVFLILFFLVQDAPKHAQIETKEETSQNITIGAGLKLILAKWQNWFFAIYAGMINIPIFLLGALWGSSYFINVHHFSATIASAIVLFLFVGQMLGAPMIGYLSERGFSKKGWMLLCAVLSIIFIFIALHAGDRGYIFYMLLMFGIGFVSGAQILGYAMIIQYNPPAISGTAASLISSILILVGGFSQQTYGYLESWHAHSAFLQGIFDAPDSFAILILPFAFMIALTSALLIKERKEHHG